MLFYLITPWQYLLRLGILFYILSRLGSISKKTNLQKPKLNCYKSSSWNLKNNPGLQKPRLQKPELRKLKLNKQRHAGVLEWEIPCEHAEEVVDFASGRGYSIGQRGKFAKHSCQKFRKNNIVYAAPIVTRIASDFISMISHVKSYVVKTYEIHDFRKFLFTRNFQAKTRQRHFVNSNFQTSPIPRRTSSSCAAAPPPPAAAADSVWLWQQPVMMGRCGYLGDADQLLTAGRWPASLAGSTLRSLWDS